MKGASCPQKRRPKSTTEGEHHGLLLPPWTMEISGNIWKYLEIYGNIWKYLEIYGNIWKYLEISGTIWKYLEIFGNI
jgi:hypothetical protein